MMGLPLSLARFVGGYAASGVVSRNLDPHPLDTEEQRGAVKVGQAVHSTGQAIRVGPSNR
jgi:hypothetical protein